MASGARALTVRWAMLALCRRLPRALLLLPLLLAGCASLPHHGPNDPFEQTNRAVFAFNNTVNRNVTLPIAWVYIYGLPRGVRNGLNNFFANAQSPVTFANDVLQGEIGRAGATLARFVLNTTAGLGGFFDIAARNGLAPHTSDFGQTLALYGVPSGPFLVLPVIGPTTPRDFVGTGVDLITDPFFYIPADWTLLGHTATVVGLHTLAPFQANAASIVLRRNLGRGSVDPYATMRSVYRQQRARQIAPGPPDLGD